MFLGTKTNTRRPKRFLEHGNTEFDSFVALLYTIRETEYSNEITVGDRIFKDKVEPSARMHKNIFEVKFTASPPEKKENTRFHFVSIGDLFRTSQLGIRDKDLQNYYLLLFSRKINLFSFQAREIDTLYTCRLNAFDLKKIVATN